MPDYTPEEAALSYGFIPGNWEEGQQIFRDRFGRRAVNQMARQFRVSEATARRWLGPNPPERIRPTLAYQSQRYVAFTAARRIATAQISGTCTVLVRTYSGGDLGGSPLRTVPTFDLSRNQRAKTLFDQTADELWKKEYAKAGSKFAEGIAEGYGLETDLVEIEAFRTIPALS